METIEQPLFESKPPHVYTAIAEVTGKLAKTGIGKDRKNDQQGYKFRGIDDVYNALSSLISEAKLCLLPRVTSREVTERQTQRGGVLFYVVCGMDFELVSAVDGSRHTVHVIGEAMDSGDKATNKAMSAAYKYMAMQVFCIPTEGDNDADATTHTVKPAEKPLPYTKPGIGFHSPIPDEDPAVSTLADLYASNFIKGCQSQSADTICQLYADMANEVDDNGAKWFDVLKTAVWDRLDSKQRKYIKTILDAAKEPKAA